MHNCWHDRNILCPVLKQATITIVSAPSLFHSWPLSCPVTTAPVSMHEWVFQLSSWFWSCPPSQFVRGPLFSPALNSDSPFRSRQGGFEASQPSSKRPRFPIRPWHIMHYMYIDFFNTKKDFVIMRHFKTYLALLSVHVCHWKHKLLCNNPYLLIPLPRFLRVMFAKRSMENWHLLGLSSILSL